MSRLLRAEWLKASSTRMWWVLFGVGIGLTALSVVPAILLSGTDPQFSLETTTMMNQMWAGIASASVIALVLGIIAVTGEFRHQTITESFLIEPRRTAFVTAKAVVQAAWGVLLALVCGGMGILLAIALLPTQPHLPVDWGHVFGVYGAAVLLFALYAVLGVAVGALIRSQVIALVVALLWVMLIEPLIVTFLPDVGKWLPGGGANAFLQSSPDLLPLWGGALLLLGYTVVFSAIAVRTTLQRDIT